MDESFLCPPVAQLVVARSLYLRGRWFESNPADTVNFQTYSLTGRWFESNPADKIFFKVGFFCYCAQGKRHSPREDKKMERSSQTEPKRYVFRKKSGSIIPLAGVPDSFLRGFLPEVTVKSINHSTNQVWYLVYDEANSVKSVVNQDFIVTMLKNDEIVEQHTN